MLVKLLEEAPATQFSSELERVRKGPNTYEQMDAYDKYLLQAFFLLYGKRNDRDRLVYLLSAKCPRFIATSPVELEVASVEINQPFLILFDSYDAAINGERRYLLSILRDSFKDLSKDYPNNQEFVSVSKSWYLANQSKVIANPYYHPLGLGPQRDLFVSKLP